MNSDPQLIPVYEPACKIEDLFFFYLDGKKIWAVIDCSFRTEDEVTILDWKTGRTNTSDVSLQLSCYAMQGKEKWVVNS